MTDPIQKQVDDYLSGKIPFVDMSQEKPPQIHVGELVAREATFDELVGATARIIPHDDGGYHLEIEE